MTDSVLKAEDIDRMGQTIMTLTKELWVLRDRQRILEAALADKGVLDSQTIDTYEPDAKLTELLATERRELIDSVLDTLNTPSLDAPHR